LSYLKLIRYQNLLFIALVQVLIKYGLFNPLNIETNLNSLHFTLLVIATISLAAAGYIINDIYDVTIDSINQPTRVIVGKKLTETTANRLFIILNVLGVGIGFYLANSIEKPVFAAIFIVISASLYIYASYLKGVLLLGNLVISALVAMSLLIVPIFDLLPVINTYNQEALSAVFKIVLHFSCFAFGINFIREIIKDLQDINGDKNGGLNTLPIVLGRKRTTNIAFLLGVLLVFSVVYYMYVFLYTNQILLLYFLFAIVGPLLYFSLKCYDAETKKEYGLLSKLLKIIMFLGICAIPLFGLLNF